LLWDVAEWAESYRDPRRPAVSITDAKISGSLIREFAHLDRLTRLRDARALRYAPIASCTPTITPTPGYTTPRR